MADQTASPSNKGWVVTIAGLCINLALGVLYTWSIFTAKFTTVLTLGVAGALQKKGEVLAGAGPIPAADAVSVYHLTLAKGAKTVSGFFVSGLTNPKEPALGYKTVAVAKTVLNEHAYNWAATDALAPYALCLLVFAFTMVFAGRLQDKYGPRIVATAGGAFVGLGMILASFSNYSAKGDHTMLLVGFGILTGIGIGLGYASATPAAVKWFHPSRRGLISGIVVGGFGLASVYTAPLTTQLIAGQGLNGTFMYLGIAFLIAIILFAQLLQNPPAGFTPEVPANFVEKQSSATAVATQKRDYDWPAMVKTPQYYLLWLMFAFASFAGLMMVGLIAKVAPELLSPAEYAVMSSAEIAGIALASGFLLVMALAIGNGFGRPIIGIVSDKIGRVPSMIIIFIGQAVLVALVLPNSHNIYLLLLVAMLIGAMYGSNLALFPAATYDFFGTKHGGVNYGLVFTAWGVGGALGNYAAGWVKDATGTFTPAYYIAAGLLVAAAVLALVVKPPKHGSEDVVAEHLGHEAA